MVKILLVEDDKTLLETVEYNLAAQGYQVVAASDGRQALAIAREEKPDLALLDVMLPGMDGLELCRQLRQESAIPILMITARTDEVDRVVGLEVGADDYITKPFSMRELMARVKAHLRRIKLIREAMESETEAFNPSKNSRILQFDDLIIDQKRREVRLKDKPLRIKPKEYDLLEFLAKHKGVALSRGLILERVWEWSYDGNSRTVDVHVRWLREKIEPDQNNPSRIVTVRGIGYRFEG